MTPATVRNPKPATPNPQPPARPGAERNTLMTGSDPILLPPWKRPPAPRTPPAGGR
ncbi:hypothetical protein ABIA33_004736 [Streptacidiphilus sp. MAP12-16]